ncbi:MAG TPA: MarR family transcriptional regulator [Candidatus Acidoferrum sp.]|nr:MarR family transcriptional regulator [Candidatus Acidoferrum sp.]
MRAGRGFDADTHNSIGYLLRDTARRILSDLTTRLEPHGITLPQYYVLRELWEEEGLTQREIANRVGVLEPTMVATLDALVRLGLIERVRSTTDRRKTHVQLTPAARTMRDTLHGYAADVLEGALSGISDDEIAVLRRTLQRIKGNLA